MHECHAFREILVELQGAGERAGDLRDLDRMRQPRPVMIAIRPDEDLRLVLQTPKGRCVDNAVTVTLEIGTRQAAPFFEKATTALPGIGGENCPFPGSETQCCLINRHACAACSPLTQLLCLHTYSQQSRKAMRVSKRLWPASQVQKSPNCMTMR